tara:strand:- start:845 stop:1033 length:189 start_codon:yes stop_codon:yes gene_type:complete
VPDAKITARDFLDNDGRYQVTRDNKKHINPNEAAEKHAEAGVVQNHKDGSNNAEPINTRSVR